MRTDTRFTNEPRETDKRQGGRLRPEEKGYAVSAHDRRLGRIIACAVVPGTNPQRSCFE